MESTKVDSRCKPLIPFSGFFYPDFWLMADVRDVKRGDRAGAMHGLLIRVCVDQSIFFGYKRRVDAFVWRLCGIRV
jgi:hypothetical protein